ncbi:MAG: DUF3883 domain-containing protein [Pseudomonadales bacterium]|nr:DUF3883 domain-containing protein [Pseudomonadales bacterium]
MSLLHYENRFSQLNPNRAGGKTSPHKIAMLLAVMDLIESGHITNNEIYYTERLTQTFTQHFDALKTEADRNNAHLPFFHLRGEGFWHHQAKPGRLQAYSELTTASSSKKIDENISFAYFDDELFELLNNLTVRELYKTALYKNITITENQRQTLLEVGNGWDWLECEACVQDYFSMLFKQIAGEKYNKAEHNRNLQLILDKRSNGSIEFKHQNISAILVELGQPYIIGYKPAFNYQSQLRDVVLAHLAANQTDLDLLAQQQTVIQPETFDWQAVIDNEIPEKIAIVAEPKRKYLARKINFAQREARNRNLGENGEQFVINFEQNRLIQAGREDLANEVQWSSKERGDGLGYDIRSFIWQDDQPIEEEHFIEVKTTNSGKYFPFFISDNEVAFSKDHALQYSLYRVFDFKQQARLFQLTGAVEQHVNLKAKTYRASFS